VRSRERDGCFGGKLDLVRTFMVCIDGSALFLMVVFPSLFVLIFRVLCWRCFENDFLGLLVGVTYEDLVPLWLVTLPPNLSRIRLILVVFRVGRVLDLEKRFRIDSFEVEDAQQVTQLFPKFFCNPWSDSGDRARGS
jgi:hypothetical protein